MCSEGSLKLLCSSSHFTHTLQVSHVLAALQAGNRGTQACITAASAVSGIIADLDTTIMFATAGTLNRENSETFADHRYPGTVSSLCSARDRGVKLCPVVFLSCGPAPRRASSSQNSRLYMKKPGSTVSLYPKDHLCSKGLYPP